MNAILEEGKIGSIIHEKKTVKKTNKKRRNHDPKMQDHVPWPLQQNDNGKKLSCYLNI